MIRGDTLKLPYNGCGPENIGMKPKWNLSKTGCFQAIRLLRYYADFLDFRP